MLKHLQLLDLLVLHHAGSLEIDREERNHKSDGEQPQERGTSHAVNMRTRLSRRDVQQNPIIQNKSSDMTLDSIHFN